MVLLQYFLTTWKRAPTTDTSALRLLTVGITATGTAAAVDLAFMVTAKLVLQKVRSTFDLNESCPTSSEHLAVVSQHFWDILTLDEIFLVFAQKR